MDSEKGARNGRKKIKIERISDVKNRQVTFNKRKVGLMKKAIELAVLCECKVALVIIQDDKLFQYSSDPIEEIIDEFYEYEGNFEVLDNTDLHNLRPGKASSIRIGKKTKGLNPYSIETSEPTDPSQTPSGPFQYNVVSPVALQNDTSSLKRARMPNGFALYKGVSLGTPGTGTSKPVTPDGASIHVPSQFKRNGSFGGRENPYFPGTPSLAQMERWVGNSYVQDPSGYLNLPHHPKPRHATLGVQTSAQNMPNMLYEASSGFPQLQLESHPSLTNLINERQDSFGPSMFHQNNGQSDLSLGFLMHDIAAGRTSQLERGPDVIAGKVSEGSMHKDKSAFIEVESEKGKEDGKRAHQVKDKGSSKNYSSDDPKQI